MNFTATPFSQYRNPVGFGPSLKTCPWWPPQRAQWYSSHRLASFGLALGLDGALDHVPEARPAGSAVVFGARFEQRQVAAGANEDALALFVVERARERPFGAFLAQDLVLLGREHLAPFGVGLDHLDDGRRRVVRRVEVHANGGAGRGAGCTDQEMATVHHMLRESGYAIGRTAARNLTGDALGPAERAPATRSAQARRALPALAEVAWATFAEAPLTRAFFGDALTGFAILAVRTGIVSPVSSQYLTLTASAIRV